MADCHVTIIRGDPNSCKRSTHLDMLYDAMSLLYAWGNAENNADNNVNINTREE